MKDSMIVTLAGGSEISGKTLFICKGIAKFCPKN